MPAEAPSKEHRKSSGRSRITNGTATVAADGRTIWVRRLRDLIEAHEQDLGGTDNLNQAQRSLVRRAATLSVELERMEATFATAGKITAEDLDSYQRASNTLRRHLEVLGLREPGQRQMPEQKGARIITGDGRVVQDVRDSLADYGVAIGKKQAKYETARRIAYAVAQAKETGERLHPNLAELAVELRLADFADGEAPPDTEDDTVNSVEMAQQGWTPIKPPAEEVEPETRSEAPPVWQDIQVKSGGIL